MDRIVCVKVFSVLYLTVDVIRFPSLCFLNKSVSL